MIQMTIFDYIEKPEPKVGEFVEEAGPVIPHIMVKSYIGKKVLYDCSTQSHKWYRCGILEKYIPYEGSMRHVIRIGKKNYAYVTRRYGEAASIYGTGNIYEIEPFDFDKRLHRKENQQK